MGLKSCLWNEDVDLTGGSAAVAAALAAGIRGGFVLDGADSILAPRSEGLSIRGLFYGQEVASIEGGTFTMAGNPYSPLSIGGTNLFPHGGDRLLGLNIPIASRADLDFLGFDHAAQCQEYCSCIINDTETPDVWGITPHAQFETTMVVNLVTAARVANTQSGHTDICGRTTAYTDGQAQIPDRPNIDIYVLGMLVRDAAGYSGLGLMSPNVKGKESCNLDFPCQATVDEFYDMQEIFGGALHCTAQDPFELYGFGVGTDANAQSLLYLGVSGL